MQGILDISISLPAGQWSRARSINILTTLILDHLSNFCVPWHIRQIAKAERAARFYATPQASICSSLPDSWPFGYQGPDTLGGGIRQSHRFRKLHTIAIAPKHAELKLCRLGHQARVPSRFPDQFDIDVAQSFDAGTASRTCSGISPATGQPGRSGSSSPRHCSRDQMIDLIVRPSHRYSPGFPVKYAFNAVTIPGSSGCPTGARSKAARLPYRSPASSGVVISMLFIPKDPLFALSFIACPSCARPASRISPHRILLDAGQNLHAIGRYLIQIGQIGLVFGPVHKASSSRTDDAHPPESCLSISVINDAEATEMAQPCP